MKSHNYERITEAQSPSLGAMLNQKSKALATHLENGATALAAFAAALSEEEWRTRLPKDGRKVSLVVHHVATMYPIEIRLANLPAAQPITDVTRDAVDTISRDHARERQRRQRSRTRAVENQQRGGGRGNPGLCRRRELDRAARVSLSRDAPSSGAPQFPPSCLDQSGTGALMSSSVLH